MNSRVRNLVWGRFLSIEGPEPTRSLPSSALPSSLKEQVFAGLREPARHEFLSIARERNREIFEESLFNFAGREESRGNPAAAAALYDFLRQRGEKEALRHHAETAFRALHGEGPFAFRLERLSRDFLDRGSDLSLPAVLFLTGSLFQGVRLTALGGLWRSPVARFWTRGVGAEALAWGIGLTAEVPALTFGMRGLNALRGIEQDGSAAAVSRDLLVNGINLFAFKSAVSLVPTALSGMRASQALPSSLLRVAEKTLPAGATFAGILAAQAAEAGLEPNNPRGGEKTLLDSLFTWLHLNLVGKLLGSWGNGRWENLRREITQRSQTQPIRFTLAPSAAEKEFSPAGRVTQSLPTRDHIHMMADHGNPNRPSSPSSVAPAEKAADPQPLPLAAGPIRDRFMELLSQHQADSHALISLNLKECVWRHPLHRQAAVLHTIANLLDAQWLPEYNANKYFTALSLLKIQLRFLLKEISGPAAKEVQPFDPQIQEAARAFYGAANGLYSFLVNGHIMGIKEPTKSIARVRESLYGLPISKSGASLPPVSFLQQRPWMNPLHPEGSSAAPPYEFRHTETGIVFEIPGENQTILLMGDIPEIRATLAQNHRVELQASLEHYRWDFIGRATREGNGTKVRGSRVAGPPAPVDYLEAYDAIPEKTLE
jgi:hypothetical protein